MGAEQRVVHVAGDEDFRVGGVRLLDLYQPVHIGDDGGQRHSRSVQKAEPQSCRHTDPSVIGGAASDADDDALHATCHRILQHQTRAVRASRGRIKRKIADHGEAGGGAHFHDGLQMAWGVDESIAGGDRAVLRIESSGFAPFAVQGGDDGLGGSFAPVSDGAEIVGSFR